MEFITDKGSKIHLVDLPHNVVYNEVGTRPQHRRRRVDDTDYINMALNDDDWVHHILRCNNIDYKHITLLKSPEGGWYYYMISIDNDIYYYSRATKNGNHCIIAENVFQEIERPTFDPCNDYVMYKEEVVEFKHPFPAYTDGMWVYCIEYKNEMVAAKESELKYL